MKSAVNNSSKEKDQGKLNPINILKGHTNDITSVDFYGKNLLASGSSDKSVRIYKWQPGDKFEQVAQSPLLGHRYGINCVVFSPFGTKLASASTDGQTIIWNVKTGEKIACLQLSQEAAGIRTCCFSPNSSLLATGGDGDAILVWDLASYSLLREIGGHETTTSSIAFSPDGCCLAAGYGNGELKIYDGMYGHSLPLAMKQEVHDLGISSLHFNPIMGKEDNVLIGKQYMLATAGQDTDIHLWVIKMGTQASDKKPVDSAGIKLYHTLCGHKSPVMMVRFSTSGTLLASASGDKTVRLWNILKMTPLGIFEGHQRYVTSCAFSDDGTLLAAGGGDRIVCVWKVDESMLARHGVGATGARVRKMLSLFPCHRLRENKKLLEWNTEDVCDWLTEHGLAEYCHNFKSNAIDGREIGNVTAHALEHTLGVDALGHRNKIMRLIKNFRKEDLGTFASGNDKIPQEFLCPITQEFMVDPVLCADGFSYERHALEAWFSQGKKTSPLTNEKLSHMLLTPNRTLRNLIVRYKEENT